MVNSRSARNRRPFCRTFVASPAALSYRVREAYAFSGSDVFDLHQSGGGAPSSSPKAECSRAR